MILQLQRGQPDAAALRRHSSQLSWAMPQLLSVAAQWLLLGGVTRLVDYWAKDVDSRSYLDQLQKLGFQTLGAGAAIVAAELD